jgi:hypothetical protein
MVGPDLSEIVLVKWHKLDRVILGAILQGDEVVDHLKAREWQPRDGVARRVWRRVLAFEGDHDELVVYLIGLAFSGRDPGIIVDWINAYFNYSPLEKQAYGTRAVTAWALDEIANLQNFLTSTARVFRLIRDQWWIDPYRLAGVE